MRRIALLTPTYHGRDGISCVAREMVAALSQPTFTMNEVTVLSLCDSRAKFSGNVSHAAAVTCAGGSRLRFVAHVLMLCVTRPFELIVANHLSLLPVSMVLRRAPGKVVAFLHGIECWRPLSPLRSWSLRESDVRLANSRYTWNGLIRHNKGLTGLTGTICPLGVPDDVVRLRDRLQAAGFRNPYALIVGRMAREEQYKGHEQLIEVWPHVLERFPAAELMVVGTGDDTSRLQRLAQGNGLEGKVRFLGQVDDASLAFLYRHAAFFVMPSTGEGFGLVFLEAMRNRLACLGGTGAASEIIVDGRTGFVVDPRNPEALLTALLQLFSSPTRCQQMGEAGRQRFEQHFTDLHFAARLRQALSLSPLPAHLESL